jgi:DNA (cytosine-5)-methyltransferase 1
MQPIFLTVDLFCGFGGTTLGFEQASLFDSKIAKVIACVNHDPKAIESHWKNHESVLHFQEDIRILDLTELIGTVNYWKSIFPDAYLILWASLECTNFSKAKGGQPRNADSRTLAEHLFRYQEALNPDYIQIENVVEFMSWGELDEKGKPVSKKKGCDFMAWKEKMCSYGYYDKWQELNSADFGAYTSRNRLFGCFAKDGLPIVFPNASHSKKSSKGMFGSLNKWKPVKEVLNFEDKGQSIFDRKKPLSDKTFERIYAGLVKFIANENVQSNFLLKYNSFNGKTGVHVPPSIEEPSPVISCQGRLGLVQSEFLTHYYGNGFNTSVEEPSPTLTTKERIGFVHTNFILNPSHGGHCTSENAPCPVIVARQDKAPLYFVSAENGTYQIPIFENDSEIAIKIKKFMAVYRIADIKMRMLRVDELLIIQGFPSSYKMVGNQTDQKKFIGNSVVPIVVKAWSEALGLRLLTEKIKAA